MFKMLVCCISLITSSQLLAANFIHAPSIKEEIRQSLNKHISQESTPLKDDVKAGATFGFLLPWLAPGALGSYICDKVAPCEGDFASVETMTKGGAIGVAIFSPIALVLTLPMAAAGALGGLSYHLANGISAKINEHEFDQHVALHLYQWIEVIKKGRLAIRAELEAWLKAHEEDAAPEHKASLLEGLREMLQGDKFQQFFGELQLTHETMIQLLGKVAANHDTLNELFSELSKLVKITELTEEEWVKLENSLVTFKTTDEFPKLSPEDITTYLYASVYFFTLTNHAGNCGVSWLKSLIH